MKRPLDPYADGHVRRTPREQAQAARRQRERLAKLQASPSKPLRPIARGKRAKQP